MSVGIEKHLRTFLPWLLVLAALIPVAIWPGDVSWLIDEPRLVANAYYFNQDRLPAHTGLFGNFGVPYGPVPTQIYQVLLGFTHDPETLVVLRGLLCAALTSIGLLWFARTLGLRMWFAAAILIAPNVVAFHRILWDASFTIPTGALCLAAFADFLKTRRRWSLRLCALCLVLLPINHPQALPLAVPVAAYLLWLYRGDFRADKNALLRIGAVLFILHFLYIGAVAGVVHWRLTQGNATLEYPLKKDRVLSAASPFLGGKLLTGYEYAELVASPGGPEWAGKAAKYTSLVMYPVIWLGILAAGLRTAAFLRALRTKNEPPVFDTVCAVLIACLVFQFVLFLALGIPPGPQYFFGTFALHAALAFIGIQAIDRFTSRSIGAAISLVLIAAHAFITIGGMRTVHYRGYEAPGWPTMANCLGAVRQLDRYADTVVLTDITLFHDFPQPIRTLRLLAPPRPEPKPHHGRLFLSYKRKDGVTTGEIVVTELSRNDPRPPGSLLMDVTPLPQDWSPDPSTWQNPAPK